MKMIDHNHFICHLILGTFTEYPYLSKIRMACPVESCNIIGHAILMYYSSFFYSFRLL